MTREDIVRMAKEAGMESFDICVELDDFAKLVAEHERAFCHQLMLDFIEEFMGYEKDRHPMFSEGYDLALYHMKKLIEGVKHD